MQVNCAGVARKPIRSPVSSRNEDNDHLHLLTLFHFVYAGVCGLCSLFPVIHLVFGLVIVTGNMDIPQGRSVPAAFGWLFVIVPLLMIVMGLTMSLLIAMIGWRLQARTSYTFCLVMAAIECLGMPLGTILGVFTIVVLMRDSVKAQFGVLSSQDRPDGNRDGNHGDASDSDDNRHDGDATFST